MSKAAEAAHRDATDRDPMRVDAEAPNHTGNYFIDDVDAPVTIGPVVPVAVHAAGGKGNHRPVAVQQRQPPQHRVVERPLVAAPAVQVDQQPSFAAWPGERRHDHVDAELPADGAAVDVQVNKLIAVVPGDFGIVRPEDRPPEGAQRDRQQHKADHSRGHAPSPHLRPRRTPRRAHAASAYDGGLCGG